MDGSQPQLTWFQPVTQERLTIRNLDQLTPPANSLSPISNRYFLQRFSNLNLIVGYNIPVIPKLVNNYYEIFLILFDINFGFSWFRLGKNLPITNIIKNFNMLIKSIIEIVGIQ